MAFAGINHLAVVIAAVVAWLAGAAWYMTLSKSWTAAQGLTPEQMAEAKQRPGAYLPFLYTLVAELIMAWMLAGIIGHLGALTLRGGVITAFFCWFGFVITTLVSNYTFGMRRWLLIVIDGGHWLLVLLLMGAIIGAMGV
jgi:hypothetical protein